MSINSEIKIEEVMLKLDDFPVINQNGLFKEALEIMGKYSLGIISIIDGENNLLGIITDGDIRRKLLINQKPISAFFVDDALDHAIKKPIVIKASEKLTNALKIMEDNQVWDLPVVDDSNKLVGLLHLHQAIQVLMGGENDI